MKPLRTCLIKIPQDIAKGVNAFEDALIQLHEVLYRETVAFEIVAGSQNIGLCFTASPAASEVIQGQVYSVIPSGDIQEFPDVLPNESDILAARAMELGLARNDLLPLKDYREFHGDPLSSLLSILSRCLPGEVIILQIVVSPVPDSGFHHFKMNLRRKFAALFHFFRLKYWFKRQASRGVLEKLREKSFERLFRSNIRAAVISSNKAINVETRFEAVFGALTNFNTLDHNRVGVRRIWTGPQVIKDFSKRTLSHPFYLSTKELATLFHLPGEKESPNLLHVLSTHHAPPQELPTSPSDKSICFFGETNFRDQKVSFGVRRSDRRRHMYVVGKSGSGKSKLLELLIKNDIDHGHGVGVLDPHGDLVDNILGLIPKERVKDVIIFDPSDLLYPPSFNPLEQVPEALKMRVTIGFIEIFKKLFGTNWSPRLEHVLRYTTLALLDSPGTTVLSILKILTDKRYRQSIVANIRDNVVKNFWVSEFAGWSEKFDNEAITPLINKVGQFVATNMIRNIVGQPDNRFDFRRFMDDRKIMLMKVSKGILGEENSSLLGAIAVTKIYQAAMSRADISEDKRVDFYMYVDEFHNFATETFGEILSEARKYRLNLTIANQFLGQLDEKILKTVFGNVGSLMCFRVGAEDARLIAQEFKPRVNERDIINLGVRDFVIKMSINGEIKEPFSGKTLDLHIPESNFSQDCIEFSRKTYAQPLKTVEEILQRWEEGNWQGGQPGTAAAASGKQPPAASSGPAVESVDFEEPIL
ncbi:MAG: hypothetical protein DCC75_02720 [Proteobacteria bacterium]|nr:MAG: hypothetical protein DCC75_02720 [Pseudomonadota bacterium]